MQKRREKTQRKQKDPRFERWKSTTPTSWQRAKLESCIENHISDIGCDPENDLWRRTAAKTIIQDSIPEQEYYIALFKELQPYQHARARSLDNIILKVARKLLSEMSPRTVRANKHDRKNVDPLLLSPDNKIDSPYKKSDKRLRSSGKVQNESLFESPSKTTKISEKQSPYKSPAANDDVMEVVAS